MLVFYSVVQKAEKKADAMALARVAKKVAR
jgi:hypothetical protein